MKRTEKDIYDFVKKKLEEAEARKSSDEMISDKAIYGLDKKIEAYEEVLNFIGTVRVGEEKKIVGTTTVDKSFEKLLLDNCPEVKKKLKAFEIFLKEPFIGVEWYKNGTYEEYCNAILKIKITKEDFDFMKEVLK